MTTDGENIEDLLQATKDLQEGLEKATDRLDKNVYVIDELKTILRIVAAVVVVVVAIVVVNVKLVVDNRQNAHTQCMNQNETRQAVLDGWHFILGYELADQNNNPAEVTMSEMILPWFDKVYAQRDCSDLSKKYEIPPVPQIPRNN